MKALSRVQFSRLFASTFPNLCLLRRVRLCAFFIPRFYDSIFIFQGSSRTARPSARHKSFVLWSQILDLMAPSFTNIINVSVSALVRTSRSGWHKKKAKSTRDANDTKYRWREPAALSCSDNHLLICSNWTRDETPRDTCTHIYGGEHWVRKRVRIQSIIFEWSNLMRGAFSLTWRASKFP